MKQTTLFETKIRLIQTMTLTETHRLFHNETTYLIDTQISLPFGRNNKKGVGATIHHPKWIVRRRETFGFCSTDLFKWDFRVPEHNQDQHGHVRGANPNRVGELCR